MIARHASERPAHPPRPAGRASAQNTCEPAIVALAMLCAPLVAFCTIIAVLMITAG